MYKGNKGNVQENRIQKIMNDNKLAFTFKM
jgi:hypothetical protein